MRKYPLTWPEGWPRTPATEQRNSSPFQVSGDKAVRELYHELKKFGAADVIISSNVPIRADGMLYADAARRRMEDPGVALYFEIDGEPRSMACDLYLRVEDNVRALYKIIEGMAAIKRYGGRTMSSKSFAGFTALPAPSTCWQTLGLKPMSSNTKTSESRNLIIAAHREKIREAAADTLNGNERMSTVNAARDEALAAIGER